MCSGLFPVASPPCTSCAPSDAPCRYLCFSYWSLHLSSASWTIVTVCWSTCRPVSCSICNPFRMLQPGSSSTWGDTSPMHWSAFTGFAFQNGSSSRWPRWHFVLCTVRRRLTWRLSLLALLTCLTGESSDLHRLISLMFRPSACQLSAVVPFRLLVLRSGTAYQTMSPPLRPCQPSGTIWRHSYSAAVTTLSDSDVLTLTIVVLVVALLLRPL